MDYYDSLVVDSNIVISGLIRDGKTREPLIDSPFLLYAPETMTGEIRKYEDIIIEKSGLTKDEFEMLFGMLTEDITIVEKEKYKNYMEEADRLIGHIDKKDVPFIALALYLPNSGIWSNDGDFEEQDRVGILKTEEVLKLFEKGN